MPDIAALEKHACANCGAQAEWNPSKQLLVCPFCGAATPFTVDPESGALVENDLAKALRELPDEARGWLTEKRTVQCQSCKAVSVFDPERVGQNCSSADRRHWLRTTRSKLRFGRRVCCRSRSVRARFVSRFVTGTRASGSRRAS
jgi:DNA-directed RNA polymerase subunit RPC12/RpoP